METLPSTFSLKSFLEALRKEDQSLQTKLLIPAQSATPFPVFRAILQIWAGHPVNMGWVQWLCLSGLLMHEDHLTWD